MYDYRVIRPSEAGCRNLDFPEPRLSMAFEFATMQPEYAEREFYNKRVQPSKQ